MAFGKVKVARLSVISNMSLAILKLIVGIISGSVSMISEAVHSTLDLFASIIAYLAVKLSDSPPDEGHPYGHGKYENISGVIESVLIFIASIWIIYEAMHKLFSNGAVRSLEAGVIIMFISAAVNFFVSRKLYKVARQNDSVALEADALHLKVDVYTSLGVGLGLLLIRLTGYTFFDPLIAIMIALIIVKESYELFKNAYRPLLDSALPHEEIKRIENIIQRTCRDNIQYHDLRTRKAGPQILVDLHLEVPKTYSVLEAHDICDKIEKDLCREIKFIETNIHVEVLKDT